MLLYHLPYLNFLTSNFSKAEHINGEGLCTTQTASNSVLLRDECLLEYFQFGKSLLVVRLPTIFDVAVLISAPDRLKKTFKL